MKNSYIDKDSPVGKKIITFLDWLLNESPDMYEDIIKLIVIEHPKWIIIQGARYAGKTMLLVLLCVLTIITQPEGDIIILRKFKNMHKDGMYKSLRSRFILWAPIFPMLSEFRFDDTTLLISRQLSNGSTQEILLYGRDHDGIEKIKGFDFESRYISMFQMDESEDYTGIKSDFQREEDKRNTDTIIDTCGRRNGRFLKMPPTINIFASNPKVWNSWQHWIRDKYNVGYDLAQLERDHFDMIYDPEYEGGNGILFAVTTPYGIMESGKDHIRLSESDSRTVIGRKEEGGDSYRTEVLAQPARPSSSLFKTLDDFDNYIPEDIIITSIGIDYGVGDRAVFTVKATEAYKLWNNNDGNGSTYVNFRGKSGPVLQWIFEGLGQSNRTIRDKIERENFTAGKFVKLLQEEIIPNETSMSYYLEVNKLKVGYGPKDDVLITEIFKLLDEEYPTYYEFLEFVKVDAYKKFNITKRFIIWDKHFVKPGKRWLIRELTPFIVKCVEDLRAKDSAALSTDSLKQLQDVWDSYMYAEMVDWDAEGVAVTNEMLEDQ